MRFAHPIFLLLLLALPLLWYFLFRKKLRLSGTVRFSDLRNLKRAGAGSRTNWRKILPVLRLLALASLIIAMARPQFGRVERTVMTKGIDIMLALDVSYSMKAQDFRPNRLEAAKKVVSEFINGRVADRVGLLVFAATSFVFCPLTLDYGAVHEFLDNVEFDIVNGNSTAIGMALANCVKKLKDSDAKSKIIILLTDGENNAGKVDPLTAAEMAKTMKIRIYTIGVGTEGTALVPVDTPFGTQYIPQYVSIDEESLKNIASTTGGRYYRAKTAEQLSQIYEEIDKLEKTKIKYKEYANYDELLGYFAVPGLILLLLEIILVNTRFLKIP